jgi:hypothetical protein
LAGGIPLLGTFVVLNGERHLLQIIDALGAPRGFARRLNGGEQECHEDSDDRDHNEQLD